MSLLNTIFGGGMSSILFQKIGEEHGLAYSIYSYNSNYINNGLFNIYVGLNKSHLDKTINIIKHEINNLKKVKISREQIDKTKEQLKSNYIMGLESTPNRMSSIGRSKILLGKIKTPDEIIKEVGIELNKKVGNNVEIGDILAYIHGNNEELTEKAVIDLRNVYEIE